MYVIINMTGRLHKYGPRSICLTTRRIFQSNWWSEDADALGASCSTSSSLTCQVVLPLAASDPLLPSWMSLILFSSCWLSVMSPPGASACRTATCSSSFSPGSKGTSPALLLSRDSLSLSSDSLSELFFTWFCRFSLRCKQRVSRTTSHVSECFNTRRQNVDSSPLNPSKFLDHNSWQLGSRSSFVNCGFLC